MNDEFDPNLSQDSSLADLAGVPSRTHSSGGDSDTLFEPPTVGRIRSDLEGSPLEFPGASLEAGGENGADPLNESSSSIRGLMESVQEKHMK